MSPASPLVPEKPLENRLLAGCHASCDYELCRDSDGFYIFIVIFFWIENDPPKIHLIW